MDQIKLSSWVLLLIAINVEHSIIKEDQFLAILYMSVNFFRRVILELGLTYSFLYMSEGELVSQTI